MSFENIIHNPITSSIITSVKSVGSIFLQKGSAPPPTSSKMLSQNIPLSNLVFTGSPYVKLAGLSGASAVFLAAYATHSKSFRSNDFLEKRKHVFDTANLHHLIHSLALFGAPLSRYSNITGILFSLGLILFCGTCYYDALTGNKNLSKVTPVGGLFLIAGWIFLLF